jgi:nitronate monooxygenase
VNGGCSYIDAYSKAAAGATGGKISVQEKTCLCTHMRNYKVWTCGHNVYRLKETANQLPDGNYELLTAEYVFHDYQFSTDYKVHRPIAKGKVSAFSKQGQPWR